VQGHESIPAGSLKNGKAILQRRCGKALTAGCGENPALAREVVVTRVSAHLGAPLPHAFPRLRRKGGTGRRHAHAILVFEEPVRGPVLVGAGRYRGIGVCWRVEGG
jgi:CRISPR-associated protein Csb2